MERALRSSVTRSLQELSRALSTEAKMLNPVFNTLASLDKASGHVKISPSLQVCGDWRSKFPYYMSFSQPSHTFRQPDTLQFLNACSLLPCFLKFYSINLFYICVFICIGQEILDIVQVVARELVLTISVVPRLRTQGGVIIDSKAGGRTHAPSVSSDKTTSSSSDKSQMKHQKPDHPQPHPPSSSSVKGDAKSPTAPTPTSTVSSSQKLPSFYEVWP